LAEPPFPPPDPRRPFDWQRDDPEWGDGPAEDRIGCLLVVLALVALVIGLLILVSVERGLP